MKKDLLLAALGLTALTSCEVKNSTEAGAEDPQDPQTRETALRAKAPDLDKLLKAVAEKPAPTDLAMGAMCYDMSMPPDRIEYVCPSCGAKTLHATRSGGVGFDWDSPLLSLRAYREYVNRLNQLGLDLRLDESALCSACKNESADGLAIEVTCKGKTTRNKLRDIDDLRKLLAFVEGKFIWKGFHDEEHPLKPELPRIRELLGMTE